MTWLLLAVVLSVPVGYAAGSALSRKRGNRRPLRTSETSTPPNGTSELNPASEAVRLIQADRDRLGDQLHHAELELTSLTRKLEDTQRDLERAEAALHHSTERNRDVGERLTASLRERDQLLHRVSKAVPNEVPREVPNPIPREVASQQPPQAVRPSRTKRWTEPAAQLRVPPRTPAPESMTPLLTEDEIQRELAEVCRALDLLSAAVG